MILLKSKQKLNRPTMVAPLKPAAQEVTKSTQLAILHGHSLHTKLTLPQANAQTPIFPCYFGNGCTRELVFPRLGKRNCPMVGGRIKSSTLLWKSITWPPCATPFPQTSPSPNPQQQSAKMHVSNPSIFRGRVIDAEIAKMAPTHRPYSTHFYIYVYIYIHI